MKDNLENEVTPVVQPTSFFDNSGQDTFFPGAGTVGSSVNAAAMQQQVLGGGKIPGPSTQLVSGNLVKVEVRDQAGKIDPLSNDYPISPDGTIHLPGAGNIVATGRTTTQLNGDIQAALIARGFLSNPVVNVTALSKTVDYTHTVAPGESIYIRVLETSGMVAWEGMFQVDANGVLHLPQGGDVNVRGMFFGTIEAMISLRIVSGKFLSNPTVHVADSTL